MNINEILDENKLKRDSDDSHANARMQLVTNDGLGDDDETDGNPIPGHEDEEIDDDATDGTVWIADDEGEDDRNRDGDSDEGYEDEDEDEDDEDEDDEDEDDEDEDDDDDSDDDSDSADDAWALQKLIEILE
jgi:hypothetical protein